ncbi:DUF3990 domain-containing protein [Bacillus sp. FDAARGOS_235]|uniref:DUF3990 domain-containing protein n=1 Tax=Bacillus sp. FDAARGOS_235 TaxID=1839798 RepID=UPI0015CFB6DB|nr:DUF3990 domain-containing protein [Bacillus sp. FDAARGOS_235]
MLTFDANRSLYHGTIDLFGELIIQHGIKIVTRSGNGVDFGAGFYLTNNLQQAIDCAKDRTEFPSVPNAHILNLLGMSTRDFLGLKHTFKPVVLEYKINNPEHWMSLDHKQFTKESINWKQHVWQMRQSQIIPDYNWTFGPVADGGIFSDHYPSIKAHPHMDQLAVHAQSAADTYLQFVIQKEV